MAPMMVRIHSPMGLVIANVAHGTALLFCPQDAGAFQQLTRPLFRLAVLAALLVCDGLSQGPADFSAINHGPILVALNFGTSRNNRCKRSKPICTQQCE